MLDSYSQLVQRAKHDYAQRPKYVAAKEHGQIVEVDCPRWYDIELPDRSTEELNLWNYWQGVGVAHPKLMVVGQDWGCIDDGSQNVINIRQIASDPHTGVQYLSGYDKDDLPFDTDKNLIEIFERHLDRDLLSRRYDDLYFTNLCLGYRQDKSTGYFRQSWLSTDADRYFKRLVEIKQPEAIVCLGKSAAETAHKALAGKKLEMPGGFYGYIDNQGTGLELDGFGARFFAVPHPGGMGLANRKSIKGGNKSMFDDWTFLKGIF